MRLSYLQLAQHSMFNFYHLPETIINLFKKIYIMQIFNAYNKFQINQYLIIEYKGL